MLAPRATLFLVGVPLTGALPYFRSLVMHSYVARSFRWLGIIYAAVNIHACLPLPLSTSLLYLLSRLFYCAVAQLCVHTCVRSGSLVFGATNTKAVPVALQ